MKSAEKKKLKEKIITEMWRYIAYSVFLTLLFSAFSTYRRLILGEYAISYIHYGYSIFEALILAKIILIGQSFGLGKRFDDKSLIIPTLYKTIVFTLFVLAFTVLEHFVVGHLTGKSSAEVYQEFVDKGIYETFARVYLMFFVFILLFAFFEIGRVLGENKLFKLFFQRTRY